MATLILTCSTGQGHNSCANALKDYYDQQGEPCVIEDALGFVSKSLSKFICWGHVTIYRHIHWLFKIGYRCSEKHPGVFQESSSVYHLLTLGRERIAQYIKDGGFDQVICTHVFASLMMTDVQKKYHLPIVLGLVATDYTCTPGTKTSIVDRYFIPDESLAADFECPIIEDTQILSTGIPVRQMFYQNTSMAEAKAAYGISEDHKHLLMMCGSMGCGPMKRLTKLFSRRLPEDADLTIVCGTNKRLQTKLQKRYSKYANIHIAGYVQNMSQLMDSADLYLTKPGGISVTEAALKNLPMVFIDAVAGCEEYNKLFFIRKGGAKTGANSWELADLCVYLLTNPRKLNKMRSCLQTQEKVNTAGVIYATMKRISEEKLHEFA